MTALSRRMALGGAAALASCALTGCATATAGAQSYKLGLADITVMRELLRDYLGTLRQVKAMGYTTMGFRLVGYSGKPDPGESVAEDKARLVREAGLELGAVRLGVRNVDYDAQLAQAASLGAKIVVLTTAPPFVAGPRLYETTRAAFEAWLPELEGIARTARSLGLTLAYHNHWYDLAPLGDATPLQLMAQRIAPELLSFEIDLAWTWYAGVDPLALLASLDERVVSMHWKDIDRSRGSTASDHAVAPGQGEMNYAALLPRVRRLTSAIGYVEVDKPDDGLAAAAAAARLIRSNGGART